MRVMSVDIETFSSVDLRKAGVYKYAAAPDFEVMLLGYAFDDEPVQIVDLTAGPVPSHVEDALTDPTVLKTAFNANFERTCLAAHFKRPMPAKQWHCTSVLALTVGLPQTLGDVAKVAQLGDELQKMTAGWSLIRYFCIPCEPTKRNGERRRNLPHHDPQKWELFTQYCKQDVEVERAIRQRLIKFDLLPEEHHLWVIDQEINDRGVQVDRRLVENAIICDEAYKRRLYAEAVHLTGLDNPNSVGQLKTWLEQAEEIEIESLNKQTVPDLLANTDSAAVRRVLELRMEMAKTSVKKYQAIANAVGDDDRVRGLLQFYGANRTGRWAGRLVQVQNLPQNKLKDLDLARELVRSGQFETLEMMFGNVPDTLSQLIRTAFVPANGRLFHVVDFSAIEARVLAWYAGEQWRLDVFNTHGKIYEASAEQMFKLPAGSVNKGSPYRQKGKVAELALGYQGGKGALITMGALRMGLEEDELPELVKAWRDANTNISRFWYDCNDAAMQSVRNKATVNVGKYLRFVWESGFLFVQLPSGRRLAYVKPKIQMDEEFGREGLTYEGLDQTTKQWTRLRTYGGKLVENIVQATARDCLREALVRTHEAGYDTVMHIHDEIVVEGKDPSELKHIEELMGAPIDWAPGLPLRGDGNSMNYYRKED